MVVYGGTTPNRCTGELGIWFAKKSVWENGASDRGPYFSTYGAHKTKCRTPI